MNKDGISQVSISLIHSSGCSESTSLKTGNVYLCKLWKGNIYYIVKQGPSKYFTLAQKLGKNPVRTGKNIQFVFKPGKKSSSSNWIFQTGECQKFLKSQCRYIGG